MLSQIWSPRDLHQLNIRTPDQLELEGFIASRKKKCITIILCVLTGGILGIILLWRPSLLLRFTHDSCHVRNAQVLLVKDNFGQFWVEAVNTVSLPSGAKIWFMHKKRKYIWNQTEATFNRPKFPPQRCTLRQLHPSKLPPMTGLDAAERRQVFGQNTLDIEVQTLWTLFINQARSPLFLSPVVCIFVLIFKLIFTPKSAVVFGTVITLVGVLILYVAAMAVLVMETIRHSKKLKEKMISESVFNVMRDGTVSKVRTSELVPGDVVYVNTSTVIEVDMLLIDGSAVVNEGLLTGESIPVTKISVDTNDEIFCEDIHKRYILHSGTQIVELKGGSELRAVVIKTGFETVKGEMIRSILFPKPSRFQIYTDYLYVLLVFLCIGIVAFTWSVVHWSTSGLTDWKGVLFRSLDILTFVVPPILPATIIANNLWSQRRLEQSGILCSSSAGISLAGTIDVVCFDKTGTLTEDDLSIEAAVQADGKEFLEPVKDLATLSNENLFALALASCHSLSLDTTGNTIGQHIDLKLFQALGWVLVPLNDSGYNYYEMCPMALVRPAGEDQSSGHEIGIVKLFPFDAQEQRMTVVTQQKGSANFDVFIKGAPETVVQLCSPESVPEDYPRILKWYATQGLRVIAVAHSVLPPQLPWKQVDSMSRADLEHSPSLLGIVLLQNKLKPQAVSTVSTLLQANLVTVMLTGDNIWTAISVSRECGIVRENQKVIIVTAKLIASSSTAAQHLQITYNEAQNENVSKKSMRPPAYDYVLATDGETFSLICIYDRSIFRRLVVKGRIFARMKPNQKVDVIESLQSFGYLVAMCGDGCNDCGAMRVANAGVSLSSSVASVAAPFTSVDSDVASVITLLREGRCTLVSVCASFKYNIAYCFSSLMSIIFLFTIYTEYTDVQYLIMGLLLIAIPCVAFGRTTPTNNLSEKKPLKSILHPLHITSILSFLLMQLTLYCIIWSYTLRQYWFVPFDTSLPLYPMRASFESTVIVQALYVSCLSAAALFSHGYPFRRPMFMNSTLSIYLICGIIFCLVCTLCGGEGFLNFINFRHPPSTAFVWTVLMFTVFWQLLAFALERWFLYRLIEDKCIPWIKERFHWHYAYEKVEQELSLLLTWPKLDGNVRQSVKKSSEHQLTEEEEPLNPNDDASEDCDLFCRQLNTGHQFHREGVTYVNERKSELCDNRVSTFGKSCSVAYQATSMCELSPEKSIPEISDTESQQ